MLPNVASGGNVAVYAGISANGGSTWTWSPSANNQSGSHVWSQDAYSTFLATTNPTGQPYSITADSSGNIYTSQSFAHQFWYYKSINQGSNYTTLASYVCGGTCSATVTPFPMTALPAVAFDSSLNSYAGGFFDNASGVHTFAVYKFNATHATGAILDSYQYASGYAAYVGFHGVAYDGTNIYAGGTASDSSGVNHWVVRSFGPLP